MSRGCSAPTAGETLVDLKGYTVLPGFMDMHTHLSAQSGYNPQVTEEEIKGRRRVRQGLRVPRRRARARRRGQQRAEFVIGVV